MENNYVIKVKSQNNQEKSISLIIEGELTLRNINEIKSKLHELTRQYDVFNVYITNVKSVDLSFLQTIKSLKKTVYSQNKKITIDYEMPEEIMKLLNTSGIDLKKC